MQRGLVRERDRQGGGAVALAREREALRPVGPPVVEVSLYADLVQLGLVMRLQREAGGNTAEVLDRVAEVIRGRMELRRMVDVLTAQARISRWILTSLPIFVLLALSFSGGDYLDPMIHSLIGRIALVFGAVLVLIGSLWIKQISKLDV